MWRKGNTCALLPRMYIGAATMKNIMGIYQNIKNRTTIWSSNSTLSFYSTGKINTNTKRYIHSYVYCSIIYNDQDMEAI